MFSRVLAEVPPSWPNWHRGSRGHPCKHWGRYRIASFLSYFHLVRRIRMLTTPRHFGRKGITAGGYRSCLCRAKPSCHKSLLDNHLRRRPVFAYLVQGKAILGWLFLLGSYWLALTGWLLWPWQPDPVVQLAHRRLRRAYGGHREIHQSHFLRVPPPLTITP